MIKERVMKVYIGASVMEMLVQQEELAAELYRLYAKMFPKYSDFWQTLALEENGHAGWLKKLFAKMQSGQVSMNERRFGLPMLEKAISDIKEKILGAKSGQITIEDAVKNATEMENSMVEKKFFETFAGDDAEVRNTFSFLIQRSSIHRDRIEKVWMDLCIEQG